jgi:hypothetical protein
MDSNCVRTMSAADYARCVEEAAHAPRVEDVRRLQAEAARRWPSDPWLSDLALALSLYERRLAARENALRVEDRRSRSRVETWAGTPPA